MSDSIRVLAGEDEQMLHAKLKAVTDHGLLPDGTYGATLVQVAQVQRKKDRAWMLRLIVKLEAGGQHRLAWQNLARDPDNPLALTRAQMPTWRRFTKDLHLADGTVQEQIYHLATLIDSHVEAHVKRNPHTDRPELRLSRPADPADNAVARIDGVEITHDGEIRAADRAEDAHDAFGQLLRGLSTARVGMSVAAEACFRLSREQRWVDLGFDTLAEFLAQPEVSMSKTAFFNLAAIWEQYVLEGGIPADRLAEAGHTKLEVPLAAIGSGDVAIEDAFHDAVSLGQRDLREKYKRERTPVDGSASSEPDGEPVRTLVGACPHCGLEPHEEGFRYAERSWPKWMTPDMCRAAMAIHEVERRAA